VLRGRGREWIDRYARQPVPEAVRISSALAQAIFDRDVDGLAELTAIRHRFGSYIRFPSDIAVGALGTFARPQAEHLGLDFEVRSPGDFIAGDCAWALFEGATLAAWRTETLFRLVSMGAELRVSGSRSFAEMASGILAITSGHADTSALLRRSRYLARLRTCDSGEFVVDVADVGVGLAR
jgi:hypothetical protein